MKMSKQAKRKITVNLTSKTKTLPKSRPSVFERLGTKAKSQSKEICHHWSQNGTCPYGKGCKYSTTHTLISPSKRAAKTQEKAKKENAPKRDPATGEEWDNWDPQDLADVDADDLEKRRQELQRELELQMKMENKARKKDKIKKKESSPSTESSSTTTESSSSSEESSSSSSSSGKTRKKRVKKTKTKRETSSSSEERAKKKAKTKKSTVKPEKAKKATVKTKIKSPTPTKMRKSQTPPLKIKTTAAPKVDRKSPRPKSRTEERKEKHHTPSPKREKEKDRDKEKEKEREREKEKEREREKKNKEKEREKEKRKSSRSPKRESRPPKKRESPESSHSKDRKLSPSRTKSSAGSSKRDHKSPKDEQRGRDKKDDKDRPRPKDRPSPDRSTRPTPKDRRDSRERERERERRIAREEREAAREKEREEALARCQERQRERERLKELAKKEEERNRAARRREDRGLDKPASDRVERLLPLPEDRVPPGRKHTPDRDSRRARDRRERTPPERRKSVEKERTTYERNYERSTVTSGDRSFERETRPDHEGRDRERYREYPTLPLTGRLRDGERSRLDEKEYENAYDRTRHDESSRRYMEIDEHYTEPAPAREERLPLESRDREYLEEGRGRRELWEGRDEREIDSSRDLEHRRYTREDSRPPAAGIKGRDWEGDYQEHDWNDRNRRPVDWETNRDWSENAEHNKQHPARDQTEEEWRLYGGRSMDGWTGEERRRWAAEWRDRSRPRSATSHHDESLLEERRKDAPSRSDRSDSKTSVPEVETVKKTEAVKRPAEEPAENPPEVKKPLIEPILEDNLSEISDDADEILNRDEEITEAAAEEPETPETVASPKEPAATASTSSQKSQSPARSPNRPTAKAESMEEDNVDLDFEEISEDELEEESRVKGIGDALGVDWASLVAESRPRIKPMSTAKKRWESHNVLVNLGISVELAGEELVKNILKENATAEGIPEPSSISHTIGAIQVADRERTQLRKTLFSTVGPNCRALSARRDLMIRRHLCNLPLKDTFVEVPKRHDPELLKLAVQMFERCL